MTEARTPWRHRFSLHVNDKGEQAMSDRGATYAAYDDDAIWGTGNSPMAARLDARQWFDASNGEEHLTQMTAALKVAPMTERLSQKVAASGGNVAFRLSDDGALDLLDGR